MAAYTFARLRPGTAQLQELGPYRTCATAERQGRREMVASLRVGGVVIEHSGGPTGAQRVVSVAIGYGFSPFEDEYVQVLPWWHSLDEEVRLKLASDESLTGDALLRAVGESAVMYSSIGHGPYVAELRSPHADFVGAIVGEDALWLEDASFNIFER